METTHQTRAHRIHEMPRVHRIPRINRTPRPRFARHYLEMMAAMFVGVAVLGPALRGVLAVVGLEAPASPEFLSLEMAAEMSLGMVVWMRYRGHGWAGTLEMAGAMFVPAVALFPLLWLGVIDGSSLLMLEHVAMLPLMYLVMRRRPSEYGEHARQGAWKV